MQLHLGHEKPLAYSDEPRPFTISLSHSQFRHGWLLGKSGAGKSTLLRNVIAAAIREGWGVAVIDPHGDLVHDTSSYFPESRKRDSKTDSNLLCIAPDSKRAIDIGLLDGEDTEITAQTAPSIMSMKTYNFKVILEPDEDFDGNPSGWHAFCPAHERLGGSTFGETREAALKNINEVVRMIVQEFIEEGRPLPEGPEDSVMVEEVCQDQPRIAVTV